MAYGLARRWRGSSVEARRWRGGCAFTPSLCAESVLRAAGQAVNKGDTTQARTASKRGASSAWRAEIEKSSRATSSRTRRTRPTRRGRARRSGAASVSFFERRGDGVPVDATQAGSHGQGEGAARADRRRAIENRRRAAPGRDETRGSFVSRSTSQGRNLSTAPEPPDVAVLGGRQAPFISTVAARKGRDARPEARRRPRGVLLQAALGRAVPRVHPRHGRRVARVQKGGARAAAAAEADVLPRPGLSRSSCDYCDASTAYCTRLWRRWLRERARSSPMYQGARLFCSGPHVYTKKSQTELAYIDTLVNLKIRPDSVKRMTQIQK